MISLLSSMFWRIFPIYQLTELKVNLNFTADNQWFTWTKNHKYTQPPMAEFNHKFPKNLSTNNSSTLKKESSVLITELFIYSFLTLLYLCFILIGISRCYLCIHSACSNLSLIFYSDFHFLSASEILSYVIQG